MWVKPDESIVDAPGLYKTFGHDDGGWDRTFGLDNRNGEYRYAAFTGGAGPGPTDTTGTAITSDWTFLASVWDSIDGTVTFYAGENSITQALTDTASAHTTAAIGNLRPDNFAEGWRGWIDDVLIFDDAFGEDEIAPFRQPVGTLSLSAALHQDQETAAVSGAGPTTGGTASLSLDQGTNLLEWSINWDETTGPLTGLHFHGEAAPGNDADVVINIGNISGLNSPSNGTVQLTPEQADSLRDGLWYINAHTEVNPAGEIRGQVLPINESSFDNPLGGAWDDNTNWSGSSVPEAGNSVSIANAMIAAGPTGDTTIRSLELGAAAGTAELRLSGNHTFSTLEGVRINENGRLIANGVVTGPVSIAAGGELVVMHNESLSITGTPRPNSGRISVFGDLTFEKNLHNTAGSSITVIGGSLTVPGNGIADNVGLNQGALQLSNATVNGDVHTDGPISVTEAATFTGLVSGAADFGGAGEVEFAGGYSPGNSPAAIRFQGDLRLASSNVLTMELGGLAAGTEFDQLNVTGTVFIGGELHVELIDGFTPSDGHQFVLMNYGATEGTFDNLVLPGGEWSLNYGASQLTLSFGSGGLLGDYNSDGNFDTDDLDSLIRAIVNNDDPASFDLTEDGILDQADINKWLETGASANGFGEPFLLGDSNLDGRVDSIDLNAVGVAWQMARDTWAEGDFNADGVVDSLDLNSIGVNWQRAIPGGAAVPEPKTIVGLLLGLVALLKLRGQQD